MQKFTIITKYDYDLELSKRISVTIIEGWLDEDQRKEWREVHQRGNSKIFFSGFIGLFGQYSNPNHISFTPADDGN